MLAYCGIDCSECPAYRGTVTSDISLLEKVAGDSWKGPDSASEWACLGCTPPGQSFLARDCAACRIRECAVTRRVQNCAACDDYESCRRMQEFLDGVTEPLCNEPEVLRRRLEWLRRRYLALREERRSQSPPAAGADETT